MAWYDETNRVWKQVGEEIGAEFEFRELNVDLFHWAFEATLVRRTPVGHITLKYRAEEISAAITQDDYKFSTWTEMHARADTDPLFQFNVGHYVTGALSSGPCQGLLLVTPLPTVQTVAVPNVLAVPECASGQRGSLAQMELYATKSAI